MISNHQELLESLRLNRIVTHELGKQLKKIKENESWVYEIGNGIDTWHEYLSQPEIGMTVREANDLIKMADYARKTNTNPQEFSTKNYKMLVKEHESNEEIIESAKVLSNRDFKERYYDHKTADKGKRTYTYMVMKRCNETNNMSKVHGVESDEVLKKFKEHIYE